MLVASFSQPKSNMHTMVEHGTAPAQIKPEGSEPKQKTSNMPAEFMQYLRKSMYKSMLPQNEAKGYTGAFVSDHYRDVLAEVLSRVSNRKAGDA
jgi:hypothetical protein